MDDKIKKRKLKSLFKGNDITIEEAISSRRPVKDKKAAWHTLKVILIILAVIGILSVGVYTGYVAYHEGRGGFLYQMELLFRKPAHNWAGFYGAAFGVGQTQPWEFEIEPGSMTEANVFFECLRSDSTTLLFASTVPEHEVAIPTLEAATLAEIDAFIGIDDTHYDSAFNTFKETMDIQFGPVAVNNVPTVHTYVGDGTANGTFRAGLLKDENNNYVVVGVIEETLVRGFNDRFYNYQMMLPVPNNQTTDYYVFLDPYVECPIGEDEPGTFGIVEGIVTDVGGNPIEDTIVTVGRHSNVSDATGYYSITTDIGTRNIFAIREGYEVYVNNVTIFENNVTEHNIILEIFEPPTEHDDVGPDFGPDEGPDVGPGEVDPVIERPMEIEGQDYWIPFNRITQRVRQGEFAQEFLFIQSFRDSTMNVDLELTGNVTLLTSMDRDRITVSPRGDGRATLTFFGNQTPGIYNGTLNLTGAIEETIPVQVEVLDRERIPIQALLIGVSMPDRNIYPGSRFTFRTDLTNLLSDREYPVQLFFSIQNIEGTETVWTHSSNVFIRTSLSILRTVDLPPDIPPGDYVIRVTANYMDLTSSTSHAFRVTLPFYQYILFAGIRVWHAILAFIIIAGLVTAGIMIKKRIEAKKKYHLKVEYSEIPKPGPRSIFVGKIAETEKKSYLNLENFKTHTIVAGSTGGGKSFSAQVIIEEMLLKDVAVIVFDPTAQWTGMLRKLTNKGLLGLYSSFGMKPGDAKAFTGNIRQINNARELIDIRKYMKPGEIQIFTVHKLDPKDIDIFVANTVREVFHANFDESEPLRLCLVYDEVHRLLPKFGGSGEGFLQIERACREFRKWGIGVMLISQVLADFVGQIKANINTEIQMRTRDEGDLDRIKTKYGADVLQSLVKASIGTGMLQNSAYNRGRPYFVTFRPIMHSVARLSDEEIDQYNEYNEQIDQLSYELDQLEELKQDVFDLRLELKLASDKVKAGNFNMVKIYIEGLTPRIKKFWDKLGKTPKKLEKRMVSEEELKAEMEKAKEGRQKFESENKSEEKKEETKADDPAAKFKKDVPPDKILKLHNDMLVVNPTSLYSEVEAMKDSDFEYHVKNDDFAKWFKDAVGDEELAGHLEGLSDRKKILELLDKRGKGEKLPPLEKKPAPKKEEPSKEEEKKEESKEEKTEGKQEPKEQEEKPEEKKETPKEEQPTPIENNESPVEKLKSEVKAALDKKDLKTAVQKYTELKNNHLDNPSTSPEEKSALLEDMKSFYNKMKELQGK